MAQNFFNFNLGDPEYINAQIDVLEKKFRKHRSNPDSLTAERKSGLTLLKPLRLLAIQV